MVEDELAAALRRIAALGAQIQLALDAGDTATVAAVHAQLTREEQRRDDLLAAIATGDAPGASAGPIAPAPAPGEERPLRENVLDALTYLGGPASTSLLSDVVRLQDGITLPAGRLASLRRDEERSYSSGSTRTAYVVPGLTHDRFAPARGVLASSAFPLPRRIIAPASGRVDLLTAVITLAEDAAERPPDDPQRAALTTLLWKLARSVPDALGADPEPGRVARAARAELELHQHADTAEREQAAARARRQLDVRQQLFGHRTTVVADRRTREA